MLSENSLAVSGPSQDILPHTHVEDRAERNNTNVQISDEFGDVLGRFSLLARHFCSEKKISSRIICLFRSSLSLSNISRYASTFLSTSFSANKFKFLTTRTALQPRNKYISDQTTCPVAKVLQGMENAGNGLFLQVKENQAFVPRRAFCISPKLVVIPITAGTDSGKHQCNFAMDWAEQGYM